VLRIYGTHKDAGKVGFEHRVLSALAEAGLSFRVPRPIPCDDGGTIVRLADGTERLACLFDYIEGERAEDENADFAEELGRATGELIEALGSLEVGGMPEYFPYYEMEAAYPLCTDEKLASFRAEPPEPLSGLREELGRIELEIRAIRSRLTTFRSLPHQLVHGDLNASNALRSPADGKVAALLDFEFCTRDLRAMEIAVVLSGYMGCADPVGPADRFLLGAGERLRLTEEEAEAIPLLVRLRTLDVFLHFLNRYFDGVDGVETIRIQTESVAGSLLALDEVEPRLSAAVAARLLE